MTIAPCLRPIALAIAMALVSCAATAGEPAYLTNQSSRTWHVSLYPYNLEDVVVHLTEVDAVTRQGTGPTHILDSSLKSIMQAPLSMVQLPPARALRFTAIHPRGTLVQAMFWVQNLASDLTFNFPCAFRLLSDRTGKKAQASLENFCVNRQDGKPYLVATDSLAELGLRYQSVEAWGDGEEKTEQKTVAPVPAPQQPAPSQCCVIL